MRRLINGLTVKTLMGETRTAYEGWQELARRARMYYVDPREITDYETYLEKRLADYHNENQRLREELTECKTCCDHIGCENIVIKEKDKRLRDLLKEWLSPV